jgi:hypothetical protein
MSFVAETRLLQAALLIASLVPSGGGLLGVVLGAGLVDHGGDVTLDSHVRYLSGQLVAKREPLRSENAPGTELGVVPILWLWQRRFAG